MSTRDARHSKLIGRIIFANFLDHSLKKYIGFIRGVKEHPLFKELFQKKIIKIQFLSETNSFHNPIKENTQIIGRIKRKRRRFIINYSNENFNEIYVIERGRLAAFLSEKDIADYQTKIEQFLHRLRRITSRNTLTHLIIKAILDYQKKYLFFNNPIDLLSFSRVNLANKLNISSSWISRIVKNIAIILPNGQEKSLSFFFPSEREINKARIKELLDKEQEFLKVGEIIYPWNDEEISIQFEKRYGLCISKWVVHKCRKALGIPIAKRRITCYKYPPIFLNYSASYPLTILSVNNNVPYRSGIYEISFKRQIGQYQKGKTQVIYLGSTKNLKKRLREHIGLSSKNGEIKAFLRRHTCLFRYIILQKNWRKEEGRLYNLFVDTYGDPPRCNRVRP